jgi:hypothetical protein
MNPIKMVNFMIGFLARVSEEKNKLLIHIDKEYQRILSVGINNNSDEAIAVRETTDFVISFIEEIKFAQNSKS